MKKRMIESLKKTLHDGMIKNFEKDGFLTPVLFFIKNEEPSITIIPNDLLSTPNGKQILAKVIKQICAQPNVFCAGIIIEGYGARLNVDSEMSKLVKNGNIKVSELKENLDIILMIISTPEGDDVISYQVDCENKTVGDRFIEEGKNSFAGTFSNFFEWTQN